MLITANYRRQAPYPIGYDYTPGTTSRPLIFRNNCLLKHRLKDNFVFNLEIFGDQNDRSHTPGAIIAA